MLKLTLLRVSETVLGTHGLILNPSNVPLVCTLEEPWLDNRFCKSCIPCGLYNVQKYSGTRHKNSFLLQDVPSRSAILIHEGNTLKDTRGCILVGKQYAQWGLEKSSDAMLYLNKTLPFNFQLEIKKI